LRTSGACRGEIQAVDCGEGETQQSLRFPEAVAHGAERIATALKRGFGRAGHLAEAGDAALGYFVDQARHAGHSWSQIGDALGVSK
jgi:hypothetical protein